MKSPYDSDSLDYGRMGLIEGPREKREIPSAPSPLDVLIALEERLEEEENDMHEP